MLKLFLFFIFSIQLLASEPDFNKLDSDLALLNNKIDHLKNDKKYNEVITLRKEFFKNWYEKHNWGYVWSYYLYSDYLFDLTKYGDINEAFEKFRSQHEEI